MRFTVLLLVLGFAAAAALYRKPQRIVGGSTTTIQEYPYGASLLRSWFGAFFNQACGGSILNVNSILTAAHCPFGDAASRWRVRVGSTFANSGGVVVNTALVIIHPSYSNRNLDNDIAILRLSSNLVYSSSVGPASIAHYNYNLKDNEDVWAIGWGATSFGSSGSETLRHVQIKTINQELCRSRYQERGDIVTENMLCSGLLDVGGRDQCQGDSGGPLIHYNVVVGICSWGHQCAHPRFPGVNVRVSRYMSWIQENA